MQHTSLAAFDQRELADVLSSIKFTAVEGSSGKVKLLKPGGGTFSLANNNAAGRARMVQKLMRQPEEVCSDVMMLGG